MFPSIVLNRNNGRPREGTVIEQMKMTPELALEWLTAKAFERQRQIKPMQVSRFVNSIDAGEFRPNSIIALAGPNGDEVMVDGYHRLKAIAQSGKTVLLAVSMTICDLSELPRLYVYYDNLGTIRNTRDAIAARGEQAMMEKDQRYVSAAVRVIDTGFKQQKKNTGYTAPLINALLDETLKWEPEIEALKVAIDGCTQKMRQRIYRASTLSIALVTFHYQPALAAPFWRGAALADGLDLTDPRRKLYDWLNTIYERQYTARKNTVTNETAYRYVSKAWNLYFNNQKVSTFRITEKEMRQPVAILGTPYSEEAESQPETTASD